MHVTIPLVVGFAFLAFQIWVAYGFYRRFQGYVDLFGKLQQGRISRREAGKHSSWLRWVERAFPHAGPPTGSWNREDAVTALEEWLAADRGHLQAQRLAVTAPLVGVLVTVLCFGMLRIPETQELTLNQVLAAILPIFFGVLTGALLAIAGQVLLYLIYLKSGEVRELALEWFDASVWIPSTSSAPREGDQFQDAVRQLAKSVRGATRRHERLARQMNESCSLIREAADGINQGFGALADQIVLLPDRLEQVRAAAESATTALAELVPLAHQAAVTLQSTAERLHATVDQAFSPAVKKHQDSVEGFAGAIGRTIESLNSIDSAAKDLNHTCRELKTAAMEHHQTTQALKRSVEGDVVPAHRQLNESLDAFNQLAGKVTDQQTLAALKEAAIAAHGVAHLPQTMENIVAQIGIEMQGLAKKALHNQAEELVELFAQVLGNLRTLAAPSDGHRPMPSGHANHRKASGVEPPLLRAADGAGIHNAPADPLPGPRPGARQVADHIEAKPVAQEHR